MQQIIPPSYFLFHVGRGVHGLESVATKINNRRTFLHVGQIWYIKPINFQKAVVEQEDRLEKMMRTSQKKPAMIEVPNLTQI
jgi:hypothetical protein